MKSLQARGKAIWDRGKDMNVWLSLGNLSIFIFLSERKPPPREAYLLEEGGEFPRLGDTKISWGELFLDRVDIF